MTTAAFSRLAAPRAQLDAYPPFYFYADEFQLFASSSYETILSQSRKMKFICVLTHQYLEQLPPRIRASVLGNAATAVAYRLGAPDAQALSAHLALDEVFREAQFKGPEQLIGMAEHTAFVSTLKDGRPTTFFLKPDPPPPPVHERSHRLIAHSQCQFGRNRHAVEERILQFYAS